MSEELDTVELNLLQQYRHTVKLDRTTSRMKNKDWYRDALALDIQLHCYVNDESDVQCYLYIKSTQHYEQMSHLNLQQIFKYEDQEKLIQEVLANQAVLAAKPKSLGVLFYLADEFSIAGLGPEYQDSEELLDISQELLDNPKEILEDKTVSTEIHAWRLFPYSGAAGGGGFATAVAVSRKLESFLANLRKIGESSNFPIRTCALSAPLCAVASLPWCASASAQGSIAIFNYNNFTLLSFFNSSGDLMTLRHIPHAQGSSAPRNLGPLVFSAATSYELENPDIYILPMTGQNLDGVILSLQTAIKESAIMLVEVTDILRSRSVSVDIPLEMMTATHKLDPQIYPLAGNVTFSDFQEHGWPFQDFLSPLHAETSLFPDAKAMQLLKIGRMVKLVAVLVLTGVFSYACLDTVKKIASEAWQYKGAKAKTTAVALQHRVSQYHRLDNLLQDRSKAWVAMEMISHLVPDDGSIVITSARHHTTLSRDGVPMAGIVKSWLIKGVTGEKGLSMLEDYNTIDGKKIKALFRSVAEVTGNEAYLPDVGERDITVKFSHQIKSARSARGTSAAMLDKAMTHTFTLTVTQSFPGDDPMALTRITQ